MQLLDEKQCVFDGSELLCFGGGIFDDLSVGALSYYCPRCDAAFLYYSTPPRGEAEMLTWRRVEFQLCLIPEDRRKSSDIPEQLMKKLENQLLTGVKSFLRDRFTFPKHCPEDGSTMMRYIQETTVKELGTIRFYRCYRCGLLFSYYLDPDYGWWVAGTFHYNDLQNEFNVHASYAPESSIELIREYVNNNLSGFTN